MAALSVAQKYYVRMVENRELMNRLAGELDQYTKSIGFELYSSEGEFLHGVSGNSPMTI